MAKDKDHKPYYTEMLIYSYLLNSLINEIREKYEEM